jgi:hypothetical protein
VVCIGAAYSIVDAAITIDGLEASNRDIQTSAAVLAAIAPGIAPSATRADVLTLLRRQHPRAIIVATDSSVAIEQLTFRFDNRGTLRRIDFEYAP